VPLQDPDAVARPSKLPPLEGPAGDSVSDGAEGDRRGKHRFRIRRLLADARRSQAVLDFPSTTNVGRRVPAPTEEDT